MPASPGQYATPRAVGVDGLRHLVAPDLFTSVGIQRQHLVAARRQIHHAVDDDRRDLRIAAAGIAVALGSASPRRASAAAGSGRAAPLSLASFCRRRWTAATPSAGLRELHGPRLREPRNVAGVDIGERREAAAGEVAAVHRPMPAVSLNVPAGTRR